jgi:hypothetical protein
MNRIYLTAKNAKSLRKERKDCNSYGLTRLTLLRSSKLTINN